MNLKNNKTIKIEKLEKELGKKIRRRVIVLGLDTASTTGYAIIKVNDKYIYIMETGLIKAKEKTARLRYNKIIDILSNLIKNNYEVVIEDTFYNARFGNAWMFKMISRIGAFAYTIAYLKRCKKIKFLLASKARKNLGLKGNARKKELIKQINKLLGTDFKDDNVVDAMILALNGVLE